MAAIKSVTYECSYCGTKVSVTGSGLSRLQPIYCCGVEVNEAKSKAAAKKTAGKKPAPPKKAKKTASKKPVKKKTGKK